MNVLLRILRKMGRTLLAWSENFCLFCLLLLLLCTFFTFFLCKPVSVLSYSINLTQHIITILFLFFSLITSRDSIHKYLRSLKKVGNWKAVLLIKTCCSTHVDIRPVCSFFSLGSSCIFWVQSNL